MAVMPCKGERPWLPSDRATGLDVLLDVDHPLVGVFDVGPRRYLFTCLLGDLGRLEVWAYAPFSTSDGDFLEGEPFRKVRDLREWAEAKVLRHATRVALSWDGIIQCHADVGSDASVMEALDHVLDAFRESKEFVKAPPRRVKETWDGLAAYAILVPSLAVEGRDDREQSEVREAVEQTSEEARELALHH
ncbi:hypothetical protein ACFQ8T_12505 [Isoptericola sp. NPDC056618]|uniref:hypothetical protein n=1 Tax=Isoptericola sp. NPDC056618 TaxID=3345878 RepID=UPI00369BFF4B